MRYGAVIIDNITPNIDEVFDRHRKFLPNWYILHFCNSTIKSISDYNTLLTSLDFWQDIPFDKVLIFQHDSGLLRHGIDDFLQYDYIGAAWQFQDHGGNGGLSLRSKDTMIKILTNYKYLPHRHGNEDVFFSNHIEKVGGNLAPRNECMNFSVESIFSLGSLGYHAIDKYLTPTECNQILTQYDTK